MLLGLEGSDDLAHFYGAQEILHRKKIEDPATIAKKIRKVTAKNIMRLAQKIFVEKSLNLAVIGPFEDEAPFVAGLHL